eukprot:SAG31_NODE_3491_length_4203_cov_2.510478_2_plen_93_part_00
MCVAHSACDSSALAAERYISVKVKFRHISVFGGPVLDHRKHYLVCLNRSETLNPRLAVVGPALVQPVQDKPLSWCHFSSPDLVHVSDYIVFL